MMWRATFLGLAAGACLMLASTAPGQLRQPEQFYSNGEKVNGWTKGSGMRTTFWFARYSNDDWAYRQQLVIIYDNEPNKSYYYDVGTKRFVGRFDMESDRYSLLPVAERRARRSDIDEGDFPPPGQMPTIQQMIGRDDEGPGNQSQMLLPPPTPEYPRLQTSSWDTTYTTPGLRGRVRARIDFDGDEGRYTLEGGGGVGRLADIEYRGTDQGGFLVTGRWFLGAGQGVFRYTIPRSNVNVFTGEWSFEPGSADGIWDGTRVIGDR